MRLVPALALVAGCSFSVSVTPPTGDATTPADTQLTDAVPTRWYNPEWQHRKHLVVTTGNVKPDKGYASYTVRMIVPSQTLTGITSDCRDLRVIFDGGMQFHELPHHVLGCGTAELDIRFALPGDLADNATWREAYLYYGNPSAIAPVSAEGTNVYLWWDPATSNRVADYTHGRMDAWNGTVYGDTLAFATDHYAYDTGNDGQASYRRNVDERDVLIEASWFHTGCYTNNFQSGVCARGVIGTGGPSTETSTEYYCSSRAQNPSCNNTDQGIYDGDIVDADNEIIALQNPVDPPQIVPSQWRTQALGVFGVAPTQLRFWDRDTAWGMLGFPPSGARIASGPAATGHEHAARGFAGVMTSQDIAQLRNIVIRRYTEPEPAIALETEETFGSTE